MVSIESSAERQDGVTLVTATVSDVAAPTRVTVESTLDGPVLPPRRQGEPAAGWEVDRDDKSAADRYEAVVPAEGRLAIGFASTADPSDPPVEVTAVERVSENPDEMATPAAVLRGLGDPSPPSLIEAGDAPAISRVEEGPSVASVTGEMTAVEGPPNDGSGPVDDRPSIPDEGQTAEEVLPPEPASWLAAVERRIDRAEALEATASVEAATEALRACGGVDGARTLDAHVTTDADALRTIAERASTLADRAESTAVATEELERLP